MSPVKRAVRQLTTLTVPLVAATTAVGWIATLETWGTADPPSTAAGLLWGAVTGISASAAIAVHHSVRVMFGRTPEGEPLMASRTPERQKAIRRAAENTLPDATSILAVVALVSAFSGGLVARILPTAGLLAVLAILAARLRASRRTSA
jgi:hypothetical protein